MGVAVAMVGLNGADAQQLDDAQTSAAAGLLPALPPTLLEQLRQAAGKQTSTESAKAPATTTDDAARERARDIVAGKPTPPLLPGPVGFETDLSARAGTTLRLFGRDAFSQPASQSPAGGAIKDDYRLGIGDEIDVELRGPTSRSLTGRVGRDGTLLLSGLPPVAAVGESFATVRTALTSAVHRTIGAMDVYVSLAAVHEISVLMTGAVHSPGIRRLDPFATIVNALSGEMAADASLRNIQLAHQGVSRSLDLYPLLIGGKAPDAMELADGDQIFVPSVQNVVAIAGEVARPAIYEVPAGGIGAAGLIELAGGLIRPSGNRLILLSLDAAGRDRTTEILKPRDTRLKPSDIILIERSENVQLGEIELEGNVRVPGLRALSAAPTLAALLQPDQLNVDPYLPFVVIASVEPKTLTRSLNAVDFNDVIRHVDEHPLANGDRVLVLSRDEIDYLGSSDVQNVLQRAAPTSDCAGLQQLAGIVARDRGGRFSNAVRAIGMTTSSHPACPAIFGKSPDLLPYLLEHAITVDGEVRRPGIYPVARGTSLAEIVEVAGGVTGTADLRSIEIDRFDVDRATGRSDVRRDEVSLTENDFADVMLRPGDAIRFNPVFDQRDLGPVTLSGEFRRPGIYDIRRGEKLSSLYARAGGLTDAAFPYGAVLTRASIQRVEEAGKQRVLRDLQAELARFSGSSTGPASAADAASAAQQAITTLQSTPSIGRMVFEADSVMLELHPDMDIVMEPGDQIQMPKRPGGVTIIGDVLNPSTQQFRDSTSLETYIDHAGGFLSTADTDRVFVILPNGQSEKSGGNFWHSSRVPIPPGSTIVVPRALSGDTLDIVRDVATALGQTALTAASIAVISR